MARSSTSGLGRPKGVPNKATAEVKALAQQYAPAVFKELYRISRKGDPDAARVAASKEILDRAYGKASQPMEHSVDEGLEALLDRLSPA